MPAAAVATVERRQSIADSGLPIRARAVTLDEERAIRERIRQAHALDAWTQQQRRQFLIDLEHAHAAHVRRDGSIGPTDETARRFRRSVIARLADTRLVYTDGTPVRHVRTGEPRYRLDRMQVLAAIDIEDHWLAIGRGLWGRAAAYDVVATTGRQIRDPIDRLTERDLERRDTRYKPWAEIEGQRPLGAGGVNTLQIVVEIIIDNRGCGQVEAGHGLRHGSVYRALYGSLARYCRIAGWAEPEPLPIRAVGGPAHGKATDTPDTEEPIAATAAAGRA